VLIIEDDDRAVPTRRRLAAAVAGTAPLLTGCGASEPDEALSDDPAQVEGGAAGPDVRLTDDVGLQQVQLEYPLDGVYEAGEEARLFMAVATPAGTR
jgi:hypothetical protein